MDGIIKLLLRYPLPFWLHCPVKPNLCKFHHLFPFCSNSPSTHLDIFFRGKKARKDISYFLLTKKFPERSSLSSAERTFCLWSLWREVSSITSSFGSDSRRKVFLWKGTKWQWRGLLVNRNLCKIRSMLSLIRLVFQQYKMFFDMSQRNSFKSRWNSGWSYSV